MEDTDSRCDFIEFELGWFEKKINFTITGDWLKSSKVLTQLFRN